MDKKLDQLINFLYKYSKIWQYQLNLEYEYKSKNVSTAFKGIGAFGELLTALYNTNYIGSGSGGMGFDLINQRDKKEIEVKTSVTFQSNKCKSCNFKFSKIFNICSNCGSNNYEEMDDSRFGINAKTLLEAYDKKILDSLFVFHIFDKQDTINIDTGDIVFIINCYKIPFTYDDSFYENKRLQYFKNQRDQSSKSNHCNLLPLSYDFWLLTPIYFDSWEIKVNFKDLNKKPIINNIWNEKLKNIAIHVNICSNLEEKEKFLKLNDGKDYISLIEFVKNFDYRKKKFNKDRGKIKKIF
ncbi:hypothetical protein PUW87_02475 [Metamycoplasma hyosynoviae]|uniref:hypothetical protein n=1 Tax=Metamycoplasma hyosynoviae TaxID=29559 RepID=UPI0023651529|nr:hypothetical protein [Metamycoplasma hyosynoviae]MDD7907471.1 hypothetical protein [Metamycoplasma hyosynoviae]